MRSSYQDYIHEKLKKMSLLERVNSQSKQVQLVQSINYEQEKSRMEGDVKIYIASDAGIEYVEEKLFKKELTEEGITFDHAEWGRVTRENIEKDWAWKMEDRRKENARAFKAVQSRSFENASMKALYGDDSLETYEESLNR
jgi:hypothetical protein